MVILSNSIDSITWFTPHWQAYCLTRFYDCGYIYRMAKIRVLVADDHPAFREGVCRLLEDEGDIEVVAKPSDGEEAFELAIKLRPNVAIIDIAMPKLNGIEAAKRIKAACPTTAIIMISAYDYEAYMLGSLRAGAAGYLLKSVPLRELVSAIRSVHAGEAVFDFKTVGRALHRLVAEKGEERRGLGELKPRELDVLKLVAKGMSNKEIGVELFITERTVQTHLVNIFKKLDVGSRTEAALHALKHGWFTLDDLP